MFLIIKEPDSSGTDRPSERESADPRREKGTVCTRGGKAMRPRT